MPKSQRGQGLLNLRSCSGSRKVRLAGGRGVCPLCAAEDANTSHDPYAGRGNHLLKNAIAFPVVRALLAHTELRPGRGKGAAVCFTGNEAPLLGTAGGNRRERGSRAGRSRPGRAGRASGKR